MLHYSQSVAIKSKTTSNLDAQCVYDNPVSESKYQADLKVQLWIKPFLKLELCVRSDATTHPACHYIFSRLVVGRTQPTRKPQQL